MYRCALAGLVAAVSLVSNHAAAEQFRANFSGFEEIGPLLTTTAIAAGMGDTGAILSKGTASLFLNLDKQAGTLEYTLVYANVGTTAPNTGTVTQAHIHFGKHHVAGGIIVFFCTNLNNSRVTSSLSFFEVLALLEMVGHPSLGEPIKLASCVWE